MKRCGIEAPRPSRVGRAVAGPGIALALLVPLLAGVQNPVAAQDAGSRVDSAQNMSLVGHNDLQNRPVYSPVIHRHGDRWIAYMGIQGGPPSLNPSTGKTEPQGTLIVDVTNPAKPEFLHHIPGPTNNKGTSHARVCTGQQLPNASKNKIYLLRPLGLEAQEVWDVTDPKAPQLVSTLTSGLVGAHKNWWECDTGIAYLVSGVPGWKTKQMMQIFDLSNPEKPRHIRDFGLPETAPGYAGKPSIGAADGIHGPIPYGGRVYVPWGTNAGGILQILDRDKLVNGNPKAERPFEPTAENLLYPQISQVAMQPVWGGHTSFPLIGLDVPEFQKDTVGSKRDFIFLVSEVFKDWCQGPRHLSFVVDITDPRTPWSVATFQVPEASGQFCERGGRFGPHGTNESFSPIFYKKLIFLTYFNAGVRVVDIRDPFQPREVGHFIPKVEPGAFPICSNIPVGLRGPAQQAGQTGQAPSGQERRCATVAQTNNVEVDDRGYIYIVDRAGSGLHILNLEGSARAIADYSKAVQ